MFPIFNLSSLNISLVCLSLCPYAFLAVWYLFIYQRELLQYRPIHKRIRPGTNDNACIPCGGVMHGDRGDNDGDMILPFTLPCHVSSPLSPIKCISLAKSQASHVLLHFRLLVIRRRWVWWNIIVVRWVSYLPSYSERSMTAIPLRTCSGVFSLILWEQRLLKSSFSNSVGPFPCFSPRLNF